MELSKTRFVQIDGSEITVVVESADDARVAVKELRHKKRELLHIRKGLIRQKKKAEALVRKRARPRRRKATAWSRISGAFMAIAGLPFAFAQAGQIMELPAIERECKRIDEMMHNVEACLLQIEGRLIHHG